MSALNYEVNCGRQHDNESILISSKEVRLTWCLHRAVEVAQVNELENEVLVGRK